jgi:hypothetical protein
VHAPVGRGGSGTGPRSNQPPVVASR